MEEYFRGLIEKCKYGELSANDILEKVAKSEFAKPTKGIPPRYKEKQHNKENKQKQIKLEKKENKENKENKETKTSPVPQVKKPVHQLPPSLLSISSKSTEPETTQGDHDTSVEHPSKSELWRSISSIQAERRLSKVSQANEELNLQQYIENQLTKLFETIGPIQDKNQLEDIKKKYRMKWFLRMKKLKDERKVKEEEDFSEKCSFKPKINNTQVRPRYLETQPKVHLKTYNGECTFTPSLNRSYVSSCKNASRNYESGKKNTYNVLYSNCNSLNTSAVRRNMKTSRQGSRTDLKADIEKRVHTTNNLCLDEELNDLMDNYYPTQPCPQELSPRLQLEDLQTHEGRIEKILDFNSISNSKTTRLKTEMSKTMRTEEGLTKRIASPQAWKRPSQTPKEKASLVIEKPQIKAGGKFTPRETPRSIDKSFNLRARQTSIKAEEKNKKERGNSVAKTTSRTLTKQNLEDFFSRSETFNEKKMKRLDQIETEIKEKYSFKPQISKNAQQLDKKIHEEKVLNFVKNKEERLTKLREQSAAKELEGVTLQPKINTNVPASSKLNINLPTKDYVEKLKEKEDVEKQFMDMVKRRKEALETIECTHRPQINEVPSFLKKDITSPKLNVSSVQPTNYKTLYQKKTQTPTSVSKPLFWNYHQKENSNMPSLFDEMLYSEYNESEQAK